MKYGDNINDAWRRSAAQVDKILKGAKPADLPIEQPTKLELVINVKAAKALGLTIPPSLLLDHRMTSPRQLGARSLPSTISCRTLRPATSAPARWRSAATVDR